MITEPVPALTQDTPKSHKPRLSAQALSRLTEAARHGRLRHGRLRHGRPQGTAGMVMRDGAAPCCAVPVTAAAAAPVTVPPALESAVIWRTPPVAGMGAGQVSPSGDRQVTARAAPAGPA